MQLSPEPLNERPGSVPGGSHPPSGEPRSGQLLVNDLGRLYVIAAPSGAGKTSLVKALMQREPRMRFSVSYTTRQPRPNEVDGRDYHFVTQARFEEMVARDAEWMHNDPAHSDCDLDVLSIPR